MLCTPASQGNPVLGCSPTIGVVDTGPMRTQVWPTGQVRIIDDACLRRRDLHAIRATVPVEQQHAVARGARGELDVGAPGVRGVSAEFRPRR